MITRSSFVSHLQTKINDREIHAIISTSNSKLADLGSTFRIFDEFPCLISDDNLISIINRFKAMIANLHSFSETKYGFQPNDQDAKKIMELEKEIIQLACFELLDHHEIRNDIIEFLKWDKKNITQEKIGAIICAYVGAINQEIFNSLSNAAHHHIMLGQLCDYINKNYGKKWTAEVLKEKGCKEAANFLEDKNYFPLMNFLTLHVDDQVIIMGVGLGLSLFIAAGLTLFKKFSEATDNIQIQTSSPSYQPPQQKF